MLGTPRETPARLGRLSFFFFFHFLRVAAQRTHTRIVTRDLRPPALSLLTLDKWPNCVWRGCRDETSKEDERARCFYRTMKFNLRNILAGAYEKHRYIFFVFFFCCFAFVEIKNHSICI